MKTKEEILAFNKLGQDNTWRKSTVDRMEYAMDEYAKEVAIEFKKWCDEGEYAYDTALGRSLTNDELYNYYSNNIFPNK